jgi:para-aminobenzoate synthetase/4-amino-4-deoxychorismate lyase
MLASSPELNSIPPAVAGVPFARFDDLVAGAAWVFERPRRVVQAQRTDQVRNVLREVEAATADGAWACGYLAFEAGAAFDAAFAQPPPRTDGPPLAWFALCDPPKMGTPVVAPQGAAVTGEWTATWDLEQYSVRHERVRDAIAAGTVYQCNLTMPLRGPAPTEAVEVYAALAHAQRGSFNAYLDLDRYVIASASPELLFTWTEDGLLSRPMKGTAARGQDNPADVQQRDALRRDAKERAENLMIVDLVRNDLSRIARTGTVRVPRLFYPERYETVWQLTSDVTAVPMPGIGLADVFAAVFPPGSVTGAPKAAALALLADLEDEPRGVYCGTIGMLAPPGSPFRARFNVAIRTLVIDRQQATAEYGVGGGITWDSDPGREYAEALLKSRILTTRVEPFRLLETMQYVPGRGLRNRERHLARLADSADYFGFRFDVERVDAAFAALGADKPLRVRVVLDRGGEITVERHALPSASDVPVRLAIDEPGPPTDRWCRHKTTRRERYDAVAARHPDADDVILTGAGGAVIETTIANLAVHLEGRWWTPPLEVGCLPGVERARLLAAGDLAERHLGIADVRSADALAVVNSLRGRRPAVLARAHLR